MSEQVNAGKQSRNLNKPNKGPGKTDKVTSKSDSKTLCQTLRRETSYRSHKCEARMGKGWSEAGGVDPTAQQDPHKSG